MTPAEKSSLAANLLASPDVSPSSGNPSAANDGSGSPSDRLVTAQRHLQSIRDTWSDLKSQTHDERKLSAGKGAPRMIPPLRSLFQLAASPEWRPVFSALGVSHDAELHVPFDPLQLLARADRYAALQRLHDDLVALTAVVSDDLLHHGAQIISAGKPAIGLARTLAQTNPVFRGQVAPILNELASMTAKARRRSDSDSDEPAAPADTARPSAPKPEA